MELVGKDLIEFEEARGLKGKSIRKKLEEFFANTPNVDAFEKAASVWRSWLRWRKGKSQPRRESQLIQAIGLGFSSTEECKEAFEAFKLSRLRETPQPFAVSEIGEATKLPSEGFFASPGRVQAVIENRYAERLKHLRDDARIYIEPKYLRLGQLAGQLDELMIDIESFLDLRILKPASGD